MLYEFKLSHNAEVATKYFYGAKCEGDHSRVTRWFKKFLSGCKNLKNQERLKRGILICYESLRQIWCVALREYQVSFASFSSVHHLNFGKRIWSCWIVSHVTKILQNFWLTLVYYWFLKLVPIVGFFPSFLL